MELEIEGFEPVYKGVPPFMKFEGGHGYIGVLLEHTETGKLQCHICGVLIKSIGKHLFHKHKGISSVQYRIKTGLNLTTPLVSEATRKKFKNNFLNLTEKKRKEVVARLLANNKKVHKEGKYKTKGTYSSSEFKNRFGTCPEQAKTQFQKEYKALGHIPTNSEMSGRLRNIVYTRFSSYREALLSWGVGEEEYRKHVVDGKMKAVETRAENDYFPKYSIEEVKKVYSDFFFQNKRLPTWGEVKQFGLPGRAPFQRAFGINKSDLQDTFKIRELNY